MIRPSRPARTECANRGCDVGRKPPPCESLPSVCNRPVFRMPPPYAGNTAIPTPFVAPSDSAPPLTSAGRPSGGCSDASPKKVFETPAGIPADRAVFGSNARRIFHSSTHRIGITGKHTSDRLSVGCFPCRSGGIRAGGDAGRNTPPFPALLTGCGRGRRPLHGISYIVICACTIPPALPLFRVPNVPPPSAESGMCGVRKLSSERLDLCERSDKMGGGRVIVGECRPGIPALRGPRATGSFSDRA